LAWPFLTAIVGAIVLAITFYPFHEALRLRIGRPALSAILSTFSVLILVLVPAATIAVIGARELQAAYGMLSRRGSAEGGVIAYLDVVLATPIERIAEWTGVSGDEIRNRMMERLDQAGAAALRFLTRTVSALTASMLQGVVAFFTLFFLFRDGEQWATRLSRLLPLDPSVAERLGSQISQTIIANVYGVLAVASAQGVLMALGFYLAGLKSPVLWGVFTAFASMIPVVGSALVWIPGCIVLLAMGSWGKALFLAVWGVALVGSADNIIRPWIIGGRAHLNSLLIFFSIVGGIEYFGFIGLFLGPVVVSVAIALIQLIEETQQRV
jgi:predicted PurR-regulated permease PerM